MRISDEQLLGVLRIGHDTSIGGEGISLRDALSRSRYGQLRKDFGPSDLVPHLRANPELIDQWMTYCDDKRTTGGYWVSDDSFTVGSLEDPDAKAEFGSLDEAMAAFIILELDFWLAVGERRIQ